MSLLAEITSKCSPELITSRDEAAIAAVVSAGRTRFNTREIGNGTILSTIGLVAGNTLLDAINSAPTFKYVKPLVEQGRLLIGSILVQQTVQSLVPAVLTQAQADALCALGVEPDPVSAQQVAVALEGI